MPDDIPSFLGVTPPVTPPPPAATASSSEAPRDFVAMLKTRYSDAYSEAHALVKGGAVIKVVGAVLFFAIIAAGAKIASEMNRDHPSETIIGIGFGAACLIGIPIYILGILVKSQGQSQLATLDTAVNSSRHLKDDDVQKILTKRFSL